MSTQVRFRGGTEEGHGAFTGVSREVTVDTTEHTLRVHDGQTLGGHPLAKRSELEGLATSQSVAALKQGISGHVTNVSEVVIDLTPDLEDGWGTFKLVVEHYRPAENDRSLRLQVSTDGGISWLASYYNKGWFINNVGVYDKWAQTEPSMYLTPGIGNTKAGACNTDILVTPHRLMSNNRSYGVASNSDAADYDLTGYSAGGVTHLKMVTSDASQIAELRYSLRKIVRPQP